MLKYDPRMPIYEKYLLNKPKHKYLLCIPIINEGEKIIKQLKEIKESGMLDIIDIAICDGGSNDGSTDLEKLRNFGVSVLLVKKSPGKLSTQLMMGYYYAIENGYSGTVTMDGNGKDGVNAIRSFVEKLEEGYDLVQGSRYKEGGIAINTPKVRETAIKLIHVPIINMLSGFTYTDTTNGFRAHSVKLLQDEKIQVFREDAFPTYSLIHYLTVVGPRLGYRVCEIPVERSYPKQGKTPTKISPIKGNIDLIAILWRLAIGHYNPKN